MDFKNILEMIKEFVPIPVIVAVIACIMLINVSKKLVKIIEDYLEEKYQRQIKIFDHKKIWLSVFWCVILSLTLSLAGLIEWNQLPFYTFCILGASTFLYEGFLKKIGVKDED